MKNKGGGYTWGRFRGEMRPINYNHINIAFGDNPTRLQTQIMERYNHYPLSDDAYNTVKNLKALGKTVRIAGKILLIAGIMLDVLELGASINADLKDADKKLGQKSVFTAASIGGRWAGAVVGAKIGAIAGGFGGPFAPITVPVLAIVGGIVGSYGGNNLGKWIVDITCVER